MEAERLIKKWIEGRQLSRPPLSLIKQELKKRLKVMQKSGGDLTKLSLQEQKLIHQIKERTNKLNINNVSRTMAYLHFYFRYPEIHWSFLGHMVSRNGGWNMTDLKGELLSRLLSKKEQQEYFDFLERGNWLIFQDVFPQFLLYEQSLKRQTNLFYLLPYLHVSVFMEVIWNYCWENRNPYILAIALVINEQSYLEKRVIQNPYFKKTVLKTLEFKIQDFFQLNQILFPCYQEDELGREIQPRLVGQTLNQFDSLHQRILLGKRLYALLFQRSDILKSAFLWTKKRVHTGSRKDYWPHLFNQVNESLPGSLYKRRTDNCQLRPGMSRLFSPTLIQAWKTVQHADAEIGDWFEDWRVVRYFIDLGEQIDGDISQAYCNTLEKMELAILGQQKFFRLDQ